MKTLFLFIIFILCSCRSVNDVKINKNKLKFSNTQKWFEYSEKILIRSPKYVSIPSDIMESFMGPFDNNSLATQNELIQLLNLQERRTQSDIEEIIREISFCGWNMNGFQFGLDKELDEFLFAILLDSSRVGFQLKKKFDRVRPSFLDSRIKPSIEVPQHASYPSNHSVESHVLALVLGEVYPNYKNQFWEAADEITKRREIAGVHYTSDSKFGKIVAEKIFEILTKNSIYQNNIQRIRVNRKFSKLEKSTREYDRINSCQQIIDKEIGLE